MSKPTLLGMLFASSEIPYRYVGDDRYVVSVSNEKPAYGYSVHVEHSDTWISFTSALRLQEEPSLQRQVLELNACLNGACIARDGDEYLLVLSFLDEDINVERFNRNLQCFLHTHTYLIEHLKNDYVHFDTQHSEAESVAPLDASVPS